MRACLFAHRKIQFINVWLQSLTSALGIVRTVKTYFAFACSMFALLGLAWGQPTLLLYRTASQQPKFVLVDSRTYSGVGTTSISDVITSDSFAVRRDDSCFMVTFTNAVRFHTEIQFVSSPSEGTNFVQAAIPAPVMTIGFPTNTQVLFDGAIFNLEHLATNGNSAKVSSEHSDLPLRYDDARYGLTFSLPASWRGYSVSTEQLKGMRYSPTESRQTVVGRIPLITLRHPQWHVDAPYQDIPILIFTRAQWDALHRGELWPSSFAGGTMYELWHDERSVFAMSSRYNAADEVSGWKEVANILKQNRDAHKMAQLYPE
jgi:hypothetical protein